MQLLDADPLIERYAWYSTRLAGDWTVGLLQDDGPQLSFTGQARSKLCRDLFTSLQKPPDDTLALACQYCVAYAPDDAAGAADCRSTRLGITWALIIGSF